MRWCVFLLFALVGNCVEAESTSSQPSAVVPEWNLKQLPGSSNSSDEQTPQVGDTLVYEFELAAKGELGSVRAIENEKNKEVPFLFELLNLNEGKGGVAITVTQPGSLTVPSLEWINPAGEVVARSQPFLIEVSSVLPQGEKPELSDFVPPLMTSFPVIWFFILGILLLILIAVGGFHFYRITRKIHSEGLDKMLSPAIDLLPPKEEALIALERLEKSSLWSQQEWKKFGFKISHILKRYLGRQGVLGAEEATTYEIFSILLEKNGSVFSINESNRQILKKLFEALDWIKFADHSSSESECKEFIQKARAWIISTAPVTVLTPAGTTQESETSPHAPTVA